MEAQTSIMRSDNSNLSYFGRDGGGGDERMRIDNGNVGIGTTNLGHKLQVNGNAMIGESGETLKIGNIGHSNWAGIAHTSRASGNDYALIQNSSGATILNSKSDQILHFRQGNSDKMVIKNGSVGIGTTNPTQNLHVTGNASGNVGITVQNTNKTLVIFWMQIIIKQSKWQ